MTDRLRSGATMATKLGGFTLPVILSAAIGVITVPLLLASLGADAWGQVYLAQAAGQIAGVFVSFGWGVTGAAMIAGTRPSKRRAMLFQSLRIRLALFAIVAPLVVIGLLLLTRGDLVISVLGGVTYLIPWLGASWYFIGEGTPVRLLVFDTVPNVLGTVVGVIFAALTGSTALFLLCQAIGYVVGAFGGTAIALRGQPRAEWDVSGVKHWRRILADQRPSVITSATTTLYTNVPLLAVQVFVRDLQPVFALAHMMYKYAIVIFTPIQQYFQSWVPQDREHLPARARFAAISATSIAVIGGALLAILGPAIAQLLAPDAVTPLTFALTLPFGIAVAAVAANSVIGLACLVAFGKIGAVAKSTVLGAAVGVPAAIVAAAFRSLPAVAWTFAAAEVLVFILYVTVLSRTLAIERRASGTNSL